MKKIRKLTSFLIIITFLLLICTNNPNQIKNKFLNSISYFSNKTGLTKIKALGNLITDSELKHLKDSGITGVEYSFDSLYLSLIHISEPTRRTPISYAVFCLKKKKKKSKMILYAY